MILIPEFQSHRLHGHQNAEPAAMVFATAVGPNDSSMKFHKIACQRQPEPGSLVLAPFVVIQRQTVELSYAFISFLSSP